MEKFDTPAMGRCCPICSPLGPGGVVCCRFLDVGKQSVGGGIQDGVVVRRLRRPGASARAAHQLLQIRFDQFRRRQGTPWTIAVGTDGLAFQIVDQPMPLSFFTIAPGQRARRFAYWSVCPGAGSTWLAQKEVLVICRYARQYQTPLPASLRPGSVGVPGGS